MSNEIDLNATASQLARDAEYFTEKANEAWEILEQLEEPFTDRDYFLVFGAGGSKLSEFPVYSPDGSILHDIFLALSRYYRKLALDAKQRLAHLKSVLPKNYVGQEGAADSQP